MPGITIDGYDRPFMCFDAHLDQYGEQSGGWGSAEQLANMDQLGGALRVLFCERDGTYPKTTPAHKAEVEVIRTELHPKRCWILALGRRAATVLHPRWCTAQ